MHCPSCEASNPLTRHYGARRFITVLTKAGHLLLPEPDRSYPRSPILSLQAIPIRMAKFVPETSAKVTVTKFNRNPYETCGRSDGHCATPADIVCIQSSLNNHGQCQIAGSVEALWQLHPTFRKVALHSHGLISFCFEGDKELRNV